jgi:hypothetical protein
LVIFFRSKLSSTPETNVLIGQIITFCYETTYRRTNRRAGRNKSDKEMQNPYLSVLLTASLVKPPFIASYEPHSLA